MVENAPQKPAVAMRLTSSSPDETRQIAAALGSLCGGGELFLLYGDLGAGKTCFVQGLAQGLEVDPALRVTSPTFVIHAEYPGHLLLNHLDLYRLDDPTSLEGLGLDDMLSDSGAVMAVEWPEMLADRAGGERLEVRLRDEGDGKRNVELTAFGPHHAKLLQRLAKF